jgi:hypothetical protein
MLPYPQATQNELPLWTNRILDSDHFTRQHL